MGVGPGLILWILEPIDAGSIDLVSLNALSGSGNFKVVSKDSQLPRAGNRG